MATVFEIHIPGTIDADYAAKASREAFLIVDRLEALLSRYQPESEVAQVGRLQPGESLALSADTFDCLIAAMALRAATHGAFDPTLCREIDQLKHGEIADAVPPGRLLLDPAAHAVRVEGAPVALDFGAVGKGFALDRIDAMFEEWEIPSALFVAGGSSMLALDGPGDGWEVKLADTGQTIRLKHRALGASGSQLQGAHVVDPETGVAAGRWFRTWALADSAAAADAFSTAWMNLDRQEIRAVCAEQGNVEAILQKRESKPEKLVRLPRQRS